MSDVSDRAHVTGCCEELLKGMYKDKFYGSIDICTILPIQIDGEQVCGLCKNEHLDNNGAYGSTGGVCKTCILLYGYFNHLNENDDEAVEAVIDFKVNAYVDANLVSITRVDEDPDNDIWTLYGADSSILNERQ